MFLKKKIALIVLIVFFAFGYVVFSDEVDTMYTEFYFVSGGNNYDTMIVNLTGGETGSVVFALENKSTSNLGLKMSFVDGAVTDDGNNLRICLSENEIENFGQYLSTNPISFYVGSNTLATGNIEMNFPAGFSGLYHGCVLYQPQTIEGNTHLNTVPRKAIFLDVDVTSKYKDFNIVVRPVFRSENSNGYGFLGADFWFFSYNGSTWNELYNSAIGGDEKINTDENGFGTVSFPPPLSGSQYLVAFKGSGSLSVGYTGIRNDNIDSFNMFSGDIANLFQNEFVIKYYEEGVTGNYLKMGDVASNNSGNYDLVKDADFALMTYNLSMILNPTHPDWFDFDGNDIINSLEQTMVIDTFDHIGFISLQDEIGLSNFVDI